MLVLDEHNQISHECGYQKKSGSCFLSYIYSVIEEELFNIQLYAHRKHFIQNIHNHLEIKEAYLLYQKQSRFYLLYIEFVLSFIILQESTQHRTMDTYIFSRSHLKQ